MERFRESTHLVSRRRGGGCDEPNLQSVAGRGTRGNLPILRAGKNLQTEGSQGPKSVVKRVAVNSKGVSQDGEAAIGRGH